MINRLAGALAAALTLALAPAGATGIDTPAAGVDALETGAIASADDLGGIVAGQWKGRGEVFAKMSQEKPYNVRCDFEGAGEGGNVTMEGECGALFLKRGITFALNETGSAVEGTYDAALRTGVASLSGTRTGDTVDLEIEWNGEVNGDTVARMQIEREGPGELRITVRDIDPATGEERVTTDLSLTREEAAQ